MNKLETREESAFTEVTDPLCMSACENEVAATGCRRRRSFSFGVAITTTSSMSTTLIVSSGRTLSALTGTRPAEKAVHNNKRTVCLFIPSINIGSVIRLQNKRMPAKPAILIYEDFKNKVQMRSASTYPCITA